MTKLISSSKQEVTENECPPIGGLTVLFILFSSLAIWLFLIVGYKEPHYEGISLSKWLDDLELQKPTAIIAVRQIGSNAVPKLIKMLRSKDSRIKKMLIAELNNRGLSAPFLHPAQEAQWKAYFAFDTLGELGKGGIPDLITIVNGKDSSYPAALALSATGAEGVRALTNALTNGNVEIRCYVLTALGFVHAPPASIVILLASFATNDDFRIRFAAVQSLGTLHSFSDIAVPALMKAAQDQNRAVRSIALSGLGNFGKDAHSAKKLIQDSTYDTDPLVRKAGKSALNKILDNSQ